jgi:pyruvate kinase
MAKIIRETEKSTYDDVQPPSHLVFETKGDTEKAMSQVADILARGTGAKLILVASLSGETGRVVSRHRPELPILVATDDERVRNQMNLSWGVVPFILPRCKTVEELVDRSVGYLKTAKLAKTGDRIIVVAGEPVGVSGGVNLVEIRDIR